MHLAVRNEKPFGIRAVLISLHRRKDDEGKGSGVERLFALDKAEVFFLESPLDITYRALAKVQIALEDTRALPYLYDSQGGPGGGEGSAEGKKDDRRYPLSPALSHVSSQLRNASFYLRNECGENDLADELHRLSEHVLRLASSDRVKKPDQYPSILEEVGQILTLLEQRVPQIN